MFDPGNGPPLQRSPDDGLMVGRWVHRPDDPFFTVGYITELLNEYAVVCSHGTYRYERRAGLAPFPMQLTRTY